MAHRPAPKRDVESSQSSRSVRYASRESSPATLSDEAIRGMDERREYKYVHFHRESADLQALLETRKVSAICNLERPRNVTVHIDLTAREDIDEPLEEFALLVRMGHFKESIKLFHEKLWDSSARTYTTVQYAEMLIAQGNYKAAADVIEQRVAQWFGSQDIDRFSDSNTLILYGQSLGNHAQSQLSIDSGNPRIKDSALGMAWKILTNNPNHISTTQIKMLALVLSSKVYTRYEKWVALQLRSFLLDDTGRSLYASLLRQERVWDMRDLLATLIPFCGIHNTFDAIFGTSDVRHGVEELINDWTAPDETSPDLSTSLALLDLLTTIAFVEHESDFHRHEASLLLEGANSLVRAILSHHPSAMKSRAYASWILGKIRLNCSSEIDLEGCHFLSLQQCPGIVAKGRRTGFPQYVPIAGEAPRWDIRATPKPDFNEPLLLVLRTALELEDYEMELAARRLLAALSADPTEQFDAMSRLFKTCGDAQGYVEVLLSRFLVYGNDHDNRVSLVDELGSELVNNVTCLDGDTIFMAISLVLALKDVKGLKQTVYHLARDHGGSILLSLSLLHEVDKKLPRCRTRYNNRIKYMKLRCKHKQLKE